MELLMARMYAIAAVATLLTACAADPRQVREYLDPETAATVGVAVRPWSFARERLEAAVNLRDYLDLYAVHINVSGERRLYVLVHAWSTMDAAEPPSYAEIAVAADDRAILLTPVTGGMRAVGAGAPLIAARTGSRLWLCPIDAPGLAHLAGARRASVEARGGAASARYQELRDGRPGFSALLQALVIPANAAASATPVD
jgi:hypothetical protein